VPVAWPFAGLSTTVVTAVVPLAELYGYANRLPGRTHGRGTFCVLDLTKIE
jgi:translation elongation factor EF-G